LFRPLCVTMAYGLRMDRLGASGGRYIVHNVHLCSNLAEIPNVFIILYIYIYIYIYILLYQHTTTIRKRSGVSRHRQRTTLFFFFTIVRR